MTCPHHDECPILICERIPYNCDEVAEWYVSFGYDGLHDMMPRCAEHVGAAMSWSLANTVTRVPRDLRGE